MREARCKLCGARIIWAKTDQDKNMPVDAEPRADGNLTLTWIPSLNVYRVIVWNGPAKPSNNELRYVSHFSTCPNAAEHRRTAPRTHRRPR